jgi:sugar fermentation stimulation protein A
LVDELKYESEPLPAIFKSRSNRFLGISEHQGKCVKSFIPNTGRMNELLYPGAQVYLLERPAFNRKTRYDLVLVENEGKLVSIDSRLPIILLSEAINSDQLSEFKGLKVERTEPSFLNSRLDLLLSNSFEKLHLETKSCTLVEKGTALFPDSPTTRGARHLRTLVKALNIGRAVVVFIIQRKDATKFQSNTKMDPNFTEALSFAVENGVEAYAFISDVTLRGVKILKRVPIMYY